MAYIIFKKARRHDKIRKLYYLVEGYRENGKVKRRYLLRLYESKNLTDYLNAVKLKIQKSVKCIKVCQFNIDNPSSRNAFGVYISPTSRYRYFVSQLERETEKLEDLKIEKYLVKEYINKYPNCCARES